MNLPAREMEVAALLAKPNKVIAYELGISARTVELHVEHIMEKLGVSNRTAAALRLKEKQT